MRLKFTRFLIRILLRLLTHVEVRGLENIPAKDDPNNFVIAANHPFYAVL